MMNKIVNSENRPPLTPPKEGDNSNYSPLLWRGAGGEAFFNDENNLDISTIQNASQLIKSGELVIFPTETVYGIGANALDSNAVKKIFEAKGRPSDNPLIVHIADKEQLNMIVKGVSEIEEKLISKFWPGPLTIIFPKKDVVPKETSGGLDTVAVRMPDNEIALSLIKTSSLPIAAPSANISGKPSATNFTDAKNYFPNLFVIDGGETKHGLESTVVIVKGSKVKILRPGAISKEIIEKELPEVEVEYSDDDDKNKSPGTKYKHYSPNTELVLLPLSFDPKKTVIVTLQQTMKNNLKDDPTNLLSYPPTFLVIGTESFINNFKNQKTLSLGKDINDAAKNLFKVLNELDSYKVDVALIQSFEETGIGKALMDRIRKAVNN